MIWRNFIILNVLLFFFWNCQKRKVSETGLLLDPAVRSIKERYEKMDFQVPVDWKKSDFSSKAGFVSFALKGQNNTFLMVYKNSFFYERRIQTPRTSPNSITVYFYADGSFMEVVATMGSRHDIYLPKNDFDQTSLHLNSKNRKYQDFENFDFEDLVYVRAGEEFAYIFANRDYPVPICIQAYYQSVGMYCNYKGCVSEAWQELGHPHPTQAEADTMCNFWTKKYELLEPACGPNSDYVTPIVPYKKKWCEMKVPVRKPCPGDPAMKMKINPTKNSGVGGGTFGKTRSGGNQAHYGTDLGMPIGTPIYAMYDGKISDAGYKNEGVPAPDKKCYEDKGICKGSYGNYIKLVSTVNGQKVEFLYAHLQDYEVITNQAVSQGDLIGYSGNTGNASGSDIIPHLHMEVISPPGSGQSNFNNRLNPEPFFHTQFDKYGEPINQCNH